MDPMHGGIATRRRRAQGAPMTIDAIALIRIPAETLVASFEVLESSSRSLRVRGASGRTFELRPLEDAVLFTSGLPYSADPLELAIRLVTDVGDALAAHHDPRGVFFFPSVAAPRSTTYEELIEEVGEGGGFVRIPADEGLGLDPQAIMGALGGVTPELATAFDALLSDPRLAAAAEQVRTQLLAGEGNDLFEVARTMAERMMRDHPDFVGQLERKMMHPPEAPRDEPDDDETT